MCRPSSRLVVGGKGDKESKRVQFSVCAFFILKVVFFFFSLQCGNWKKAELSLNLDSLLKYLTPCPHPAPISLEFDTNHEGKHYRWGDGQVGKSRDPYLKISTEAPSWGWDVLRISHELVRPAPSWPQLFKSSARHFSSLMEPGQAGKKIYSMLLREATWSNLC